ncbi:MAG: hypothetical protein D4S02_10425 [Rhodocyclaceae bacterium]|nr:MAG: hypothetical protein D4S02_10425 [Rhodocyclaceae bacterium]
MWMGETGSAEASQTVNRTAPIELGDALSGPGWMSRVKEFVPMAHSVVLLLSLAAFLTLYVFRAQDNNRLTSWQWVFNHADPFRITLILVAGLLLARALARVRFPPRHSASVLLAFSFSIGALTWGEPEVIVDVARYFTQAKHVELYGVGYFVAAWGGQISAWTDLPLVPLLYGLIFSLVGENRIFIQVFTTLLFSGSVVLTYLIGRMLWDEAVGFCAGALLLGMPYLLAQVPLMLVDVPTMFFLTLAVFTTIQAVEHGKMWLMALAALAVALACCTKYSTWLMLSVLPVTFLARHWHGPRAVWLRAGALTAIAGVLIGLVVYPIFDLVTGQLELLQSYQTPGLRRWEESFTSTLLFQVHPFITGAALFSAYAAFKRRDARYAIILWLPLLLVAMEIKRIRYLLPAFPMLALMASYGLREIRNREVRQYAVLCIVVSSVAVTVFGFVPFLQQASAVNLKQAGEYLDSLEGESVEVIALPQMHALVNPDVSVPILDLFTSKRIVYRHDPVLAPSAEALSKSSLRFTWEYRSPSYYAAGTKGPGDSAVVVIASDAHQALPGQLANRLRHYRLSREFNVMEDVFGYRTFVKVYLPA